MERQATGAAGAAFFFWGGGSWTKQRYTKGENFEKLLLEAEVCNKEQVLGLSARTPSCGFLRRPGISSGLSCYRCWRRCSVWLPGRHLEAFGPLKTTRHGRPTAGHVELLAVSQKAIAGCCQADNSLQRGRGRRHCWLTENAIWASYAKARLAQPSVQIWRRQSNS